MYAALTNAMSWVTFRIALRLFSFLEWLQIFWGNFSYLWKVLNIFRSLKRWCRHDIVPVATQQCADSPRNLDEDNHNNGSKKHPN